MADFSNGLSVNGPLTISDETTASVHFGAVVKVVIDDTSKHSDGGAWRKRTTSTSWYTEALGGEVWIGQQASIAAAWTAAQSLPGAVFQATATAGPLTSGKFYVATSSTTATEVFRGISRDYPDSVLWVAETGRVIGYDLTQPGCPMWMVFSNAGMAGYSTAISSVAMQQGQLLVGAVNGLSQINFVSEVCEYWQSGNHRQQKMLSTRNVTSLSSPSSSVYIVNTVVNDVAITVLDSAPIDPATGLPVPTIAVATAGGVSVIKDDGTVVTYTSNPWSQVAWASNTALAGRRGGAANSNFQTFEFLAFPAMTNTQVTTPAMLAGATLTDVANRAATAGSGVLVNAGSNGLSVLKHNPATPTKGMVNYITNAYNSGWLPGDIRGAYLADTTAETITASGELVTNGTFTTDTTGWTAGNSATLSVVSGAMRVTNDATGANGGIASAPITCVVGKTYTVSGDYVKTGSATTLLKIGTVAGSGGAQQVAYTVSGKIGCDFVASSTTMYVSLQNAITASVYSDFDNISVKLAEPDRSVKGKGLIINGTLTKTAVASGAGLVAYSGFSASNYLEQPYNSDLDFGTGDFCYMGWVIPGGAGTYTVLSRSITSITNETALLLVSHVPRFRVASSLDELVATQSVVANTPNMLVFFRLSGVLYAYVNGVAAGSIANTQTMTRAAPLVLGERPTSSAPLTSGSLALWRISATAPSADQIAHIYRTELPLFQANAKCTIDGTSTAVTALAYDETTDELHVGTSWGRSEFRDLLRVYSEATTTGSITTLAASEGVVVTGGTSAKVYAPAMNLRDELRRKDIARKALGRIPAFFDYTATASQTAFIAPKGFTIKALYKNGTLMRETTTGTYWTRSNDGFQETATLSVGASVSDWISIMCVRS